jgi:hypothetical protein
METDLAAVAWEAAETSSVACHTLEFCTAPCIWNIHWLTIHHSPWIPLQVWTWLAWNKLGGQWMNKRRPSDGRQTCPDSRASQKGRSVCWPDIPVGAGLSNQASWLEVKWGKLWCPTRLKEVEEVKHRQHRCQLWQSENVYRTLVYVGNKNQLNLIGKILFQDGSGC